jgi:membrane protein DedA with SNARE-associated domain
MGALTSLQVDAAISYLICRFIPGGRTAITLTCGLIGYSRRRFVAGTAAAP